MEFIKRNITLILGISIPILMILFVAGSIYLPGLFIKPHFNFLYVFSDDYYYNEPQYLVDNGRLVKSEIKQTDNQNNYPPKKESKLYIYDVTKNESQEISLEQAQNLDLDSKSKSPDGFEVVYGSRGDGFFPFFWGSGSDYNSRYLKGRNISRKLDLKINDSYNYYSFRFLGWIK